MSIFKAIPSLLVTGALAACSESTIHIPSQAPYFDADQVSSFGCSFRQTHPDNPFDYASVFTGPFALGGTALVNGDAVFHLAGGGGLLIRGAIIGTVDDGNTKNAAKYMEDAEQVKSLVPAMYQMCVDAQRERARVALTLT